MNRKLWLEWFVTVLYSLFLMIVTYNFFSRDTTITTIPLVMSLLLWLRFKQYRIKKWTRQLAYFVSIHVQMLLVGWLLWMSMQLDSTDVLFNTILVLGVMLHLKLGSISFAYPHGNKMIFFAGGTMAMLLTLKLIGENYGMEIAGLPYFYVLIALWQSVVFIFTHLILIDKNNISE